MPAMRLCQACTGPVPRASHRCPWCHSELMVRGRPEHLFSTFDGQAPLGRILPPPDPDRTDVF